MVLGIAQKLACAALVLGVASTAQAQQTSTNQVATKTAWAVFEDKNPKECWAVSSPKETVNTKDGRVVAVTRSDILLMAFYRPGALNGGQLAFTGGYPFAGGSTVSLQVGDSRFELFTDGEWAWAASAEEDAKIVSALKRGATAVLTARSGRGTNTKDTFSLSGFTAAVEDAEKRCK
ncbi:invasion associated locus B family protein [Lentibacter algarum]|uniref:invasion associated locus B family protein n=1 Tax=Lentibacter algarum TaxID=576131 RepID=UPI001C06AD89|nr:invasion associated locus B family protein [Lentibacter algarum]MBU2981280.1 invasion associated locus B family protein [Lentibacter algarum]